MANIVKLLLKGWLLKKFGAKAGAGCLFLLVIVIGLAMMMGYFMRN
jgi:hypothetical protein